MENMKSLNLKTGDSKAKRAEIRKYFLETYALEAELYKILKMNSS